MKYLGLGLAISVALALVIFGVSYPLLHDSHISEGLAALPVAGSHHIAELLERHEARRSVRADRKTDIASFKGFGIAWPLMAVYGALILLAIVQVGSLIGGVLALALWPATQPTGNQLLIAIAFPSILGEIFGGYVVGRWIGYRCASRGLLGVVIAAVLGAAINRATDLIMSAGDFQKLYGEAWTFNLLTFQFGATFAFIFIPALLGYWRGRHGRAAKYFSYLLSVLPADTRRVLTDLAFEEAQKAAGDETPASHKFA